MIVLTAGEAEKVRGRSPKDEGQALDPVPLKDGRFMLAEDVLDDPAHDDVRGFLAMLPRAALEELPAFGPDDEGAAIDEEPPAARPLEVRKGDAR